MRVTVRPSRLRKIPKDRRLSIADYETREGDGASSHFLRVISRDQNFEFKFFRKEKWKTSRNPSLNIYHQSLTLTYYTTNDIAPSIIPILTQRFTPILLGRPREFPQERDLPSPDGAFIAPATLPGPLRHLDNSLGCSGSIRRKSERTIFRTKRHTSRARIHPQTHTYAHLPTSRYSVSVCTCISARGRRGRGRHGGDLAGGGCPRSAVLSRRPRLNIFHMFS